MNKLILILISLILCSCEKEKKPEPELKLQEGYIIGFDPCALYRSYLIVTNDYKDSLVAYLWYYKYNDLIDINRIDTIYKFSNNFRIINSDTIYQFPDYYYYNYETDFCFPDSVRHKYKIFFNFTYLAETEKYLDHQCSSISLPYMDYQFNKCVRDRQIKINYATKYPVKSVK